MSDYRKDDVVIFGRKAGEKILGTITKVNRKTVLVCQEESRGTMKSHKIGTEWKVPIQPDYLRHASEAEAARLQESDTEKAAPRNRAEKKPSQIEDEKCTRRRAGSATQAARLNPKVISDGRKFPGAAMHRILEKAQKLVGRTIAQIGYLSEDGENWPVIILDDGTELRALRDDEMNGPGSLLFGDDMLCAV